MKAMVMVGIAAFALSVMAEPEETSAATAESAAAEQAASVNTATTPELTTVLGVHVGMSMQETLDALQSRSKRFLNIPRVSADKDSLALLTVLSVDSVFLGWSEQWRMCADKVEYSFYHGKVVRIIIKAARNVEYDSHWKPLITKLPKNALNANFFMSGGAYINSVEHCVADDDYLMIRAAKEWNEFCEEKRAISAFFDAITRENELLD